MVVGHVILMFFREPGRQLSLAYQIFPFGAVIGKAGMGFNTVWWLTWIICGYPHDETETSLHTYIYIYI